MPYNETLAQRVRDALISQPLVEEKKMMGGLVFMVNDKMCVGISKDDLMARIDPALREMALQKPGCREREMDFTGRPMKSFVFIGLEGTTNDTDLDYWIQLALDFNSRAKSSKKPKKN